jgi:hypothetical protein
LADWVTVRQAAARLGINVEEVRRRVREGQLVGKVEQTDFGSIWLVEMDAEAEPGLPPLSFIEPEDEPPAPRRNGSAGSSRRDERRRSPRIGRAQPRRETRRVERLVSALEEVLAERRAEGASAPMAAPPAVVPASRSRRRLWSLIAAVPLALVLAAAGFFISQQRNGPAVVESAFAKSGADDPVIVVIAPFDDSFAGRKINLGQRISDRLIAELDKQGLKRVDLMPLPGGDSAAPKLKALEATRDLPAKAVLLVWGWYDDSEVSSHLVMLRGYYNPELEGTLGPSVNLKLGGGEDVLGRTAPAAASDQVIRMLKLIR